MGAFSPDFVAGPAPSAAHHTAARPAGDSSLTTCVRDYLQTHGTVDPTVIARILEYHNSVRAQHSAAALTWDATIAQSAQSWTDQCNFSHDGTNLNQLGYGECLGMHAFSPPALLLLRIAAAASLP